MGGSMNEAEYWQTHILVLFVMFVQVSSGQVQLPSSLERDRAQLKVCEFTKKRRTVALQPPGVARQ